MGPWARLHSLPPHTIVFSPDLLPASLLEKPSLLQSREDSSSPEQGSHWPGMGHMTISVQLLRSGNMDLFWVTGPSSGGGVILHLWGTLGGRSLSQMESGVRVVEEECTLCRTPDAADGLQSRPEPGAWVLEVPWSLCSAKGISASSCHFCHTPWSPEARPLHIAMAGLLPPWGDHWMLRYGVTRISKVHVSQVWRP